MRRSTFKGLGSISDAMSATCFVCLFAGLLATVGCRNSSDSSAADTDAPAGDLEDMDGNLDLPDDDTQPSDDDVDTTDVPGDDDSEDNDNLGPIGHDPGPMDAFYPAPEAYSLRGPGGPNRTFREEELYKRCAYLDGGEADTTEHHNLVVPYDGYLFMPWAPEWGRQSGISLYKFDDPCDPVRVGYGADPRMRESHSVGFATTDDGRSWAVVDSITPKAGSGRESAGGGVLFWELTDLAHPRAGADMEGPGFYYPNAYDRVTLSVFWQYPYVYAAAAMNGVYIIDATNPDQPRFVTHYTFDPPFVAGQIHAVGNLLVVAASQDPRTVLLDISDPAHPQPIAGGNFKSRGIVEVKMDDGSVFRSEINKAGYFSNLVAGIIYYAVKLPGGGLLGYDIRDPSRPMRVADTATNGSGGYVFAKGPWAFTGDSSHGTVWDLRTPGEYKEYRRVCLIGEPEVVPVDDTTPLGQGYCRRPGWRPPGADEDIEEAPTGDPGEGNGDMPDLDTLIPIGNVILPAADDGADKDQGTAVMPWLQEPDREPPTIGWVYPIPGTVGIVRGSRFGINFDEMVEPKSAHAGSVRLYEKGGTTAEARVDGWVSAQEAIVNFWPKQPLKGNTTYVLEIPAGGITDDSGNGLERTYRAEFTTAP